MKPLKEVDYEDILDPNYLQDLSRRSREIAAGARPPDRNAMQQMMQNLQRTVGIERQHKEELERLAVETTKNLFPIIDKFGIEIDAKLEDRMQVAAPERKPQGQINPELLDAAKKRRIVNAITQGSAFSTHGVFHMVQDKLNDIDPNLVNLYTSINAGKQNDPFFHVHDKRQLIDMAIQGNRAGMADGFLLTNILVIIIK
ncbi:MAG: hypothetical protein HC836_35365 [Richelia sp. RM2_1_2]|nr:hypothetical protein [Richelia sp. RM2_1_2]